VGIPQSWVYKAKKLSVTKKLAKRSTRQIASASLAAATIGTVAVAVTMASFEVYDYCEDKKDLQDDFNILYGTNDEFNFEQCIEGGKDESKRILTEVKQSASESVFEAMNSTAEYSGEKWLAIKESSTYAFESTNDLWESTKEWFAE